MGQSLFPSYDEHDCENLGPSSMRLQFGLPPLAQPPVKRGLREERERQSGCFV